MVATLTLSYVLAQGVPLGSIIIPTGIGAAVASLLLTVLIDSFFWQRVPIWPEWVAFRYNTIEGNASSWGTSPWHFYFTNALPRLMMNPMLLLVLVPIAMGLRGTRRFSLALLTPSIAFIGIYSLMPHKEWRFIIYTAPVFNAVAAAGASWVWSRRYKSIWFSLLTLALVGSVLVSVATSLCILAISSLNYPGASALEQLKKISPETTKNYTVHLDNLSCQTGVTRFLQHDNLSAYGSGIAWENWKYDKSDDAQTLRDARFWDGMDFAIFVESKNCHWKLECGRVWRWFWWVAFRRYQPPSKHQWFQRIRSPSTHHACRRADKSSSSRRKVAEDQDDTEVIHHEERPMRVARQPTR